MKKNFKILSNFLIICFFIFSCGEKKVDNNNLKEKQKNFFEIKKLNLEKKQLENDIIKLESEREGYKILAAQENTTEKGGCGPKCQKFEKMADNDLVKINIIKKQISGIDIKIDGFKNFKTLKLLKINKLKLEKNNLEIELLKLESEREGYSILAAQENSTEKGGCGPKCQKFNTMAEEVLVDINQLENKIKVINDKLDGFKSPAKLKMEKNNELKTEKSLLTENIKSLEKERDSYISLAENEMTNDNGGCGPKCQKFKMMANEVSNRINETKNNLKVVDEKLKKINKN